MGCRLSFVARLRLCVVSWLMFVACCVSLVVVCY